jgi:MYXO-CTERM domain-containing protein
VESTVSTDGQFLDSYHSQSHT